MFIHHLSPDDWGSPHETPSREKSTFLDGPRKWPWKRLPQYLWEQYVTPTVSLFLLLMPMGIGELSFFIIFFIGTNLFEIFCFSIYQPQLSLSNSISCLKTIKNSHILPTGQWYARSAVKNDALIMPEYAKACQSMPEYAKVCQGMPDTLLPAPV